MKVAVQLFVGAGLEKTMGKTVQCRERLKIWAGGWKEVPCLKPEHGADESHAGRMQDGLGNDVDLTWSYDFAKYETTGE